MSNVRPLSSNVLFVWCDEIADNKTFTHKSGLIIDRKIDRTRDRWGKVIAIGPNEKEIEVGDFILPEKTHQPFGANAILEELKNQNIEVWMTNADDILLISKDESVTHSLNGSDLLFNLKK